MNKNYLPWIFGIFYLFLLAATWNDRVDVNASGRTILQFWHTYNDDEEKLLKEVIAEWEAQPANSNWAIRPIRIPFDGHKPKIRTALTVGLGPDFARVDWSFVCELARKNACVDLETFGFSKISDQYLSAPLNTNRIDGKYYGLPDQTTCVALFYNKTIFRDANLDPEKPPKTWDEFIETAKKLTNSEKGTYGFGMDNTLWWTLPFFNTFGAKLISDDGKKCLLDSEAAVKALEFKASLFSVHKIEAGAWRAGAISPESGFVNGRYAMIFMGPWNLPKFTNSKLDFGVALIPAGPAGSSSNVGGTNAVIFKSSKNPRPCYDFLTFFTSAEIQARWCKRLNQMPVNRKSYDLFSFDDKNLQVFMEQLKTSVSNPIVTSYEMLEDVVNPEMEAVITGQKTAADALGNASRKVEAKVLSL
ncbi:hypothetical protein AUK22_07390 [bacterium CG2_30_54_10]|nr:MAG: hypothetical protein AUK22_07390 [bacterium CG2_30_54_10]